MRIHQFSAADAIASVHSAPNGLSSDEAARRLHEFGPNRVEQVAGEPVLLRLFKEFFHFFAVILWVATALAFLGEWNQPGQGMAKIGYAIIAVIVVGDRLAYRARPGCRKTQLAGYAAFFFVLCKLRRLIDHFDFAFLQINSYVTVKNENS